MDVDSEAMVQGLVERRMLSEPMAYLLGTKAFMGHDFVVDSRVLIPRPDTEIVVEAVLTVLSGEGPVHILDIGTGSGAILISLLLARRGAFGVGLDISADALQVASANGDRLGVGDRIKWVQSNLFASQDLKGKAFDLIISNPPYINVGDMKKLDETVVGFEPHSALYGGVDGLDFYRQIICDAEAYLKPQGYLAFEIGYDQRDAVVSLLEQADFECITCYNDLAGHHRAIVARLKPM
jgi:release factor glutamine methyltransferase